MTLGLFCLPITAFVAAAVSSATVETTEKEAAQNGLR